MQSVSRFAGAQQLHTVQGDIIKSMCDTEVHWLSLLLFYLWECDWLKTITYITAPGSKIWYARTSDGQPVVPPEVCPVARRRSMVMKQWQIMHDFVQRGDLRWPYVGFLATVGQLDINGLGGLLKPHPKQNLRTKFRSLLHYPFKDMTLVLFCLSLRGGGRRGLGSWVFCVLAFSVSVFVF